MRNQRGGGRTRQSTKAASACQQVAGGGGDSFFLSLSLFFYVHQSSNSPRLFKQLLSETLKSLISVFAPPPRAFSKVSCFPHSAGNGCPRGRSGSGVLGDEARGGQDAEGRWRRLEAAGRDICGCGERGDEVGVGGVGGRKRKNEPPFCHQTFLD